MTIGEYSDAVVAVGVKAICKAHPQTLDKIGLRSQRGRCTRKDMVACFDLSTAALIVSHVASLPWSGRLPPKSLSVGNHKRHGWGGDLGLRRWSLPSVHDEEPQPRGSVPRLGLLQYPRSRLGSGRRPPDAAGLGGGRRWHRAPSISSPGVPGTKSRGRARVRQPPPPLVCFGLGDGGGGGDWGEEVAWEPLVII
jgi:hypothetical protein